MNKIMQAIALLLVLTPPTFSWAQGLSLGVRAGAQYVDVCGDGGGPCEDTALAGSPYLKIWLVDNGALELAYRGSGSYEFYRDRVILNNASLAYEHRFLTFPDQGGVFLKAGLQSTFVKLEDTRAGRTLEDTETGALLGLGIYTETGVVIGYEISMRDSPAKDVHFAYLGYEFDIID